MATDNKKALVYSIMEFLEKSCKDGSVKEDSVEGIEGQDPSRQHVFVAEPPY